MSIAVRSLAPPAAPPRGARLSLTPVIVAFAFAVVGFTFATVYTEVRASAIDGEAAQIDENALPSVEHLAAARAALWRLVVASNEYASEAGDERRLAETAIGAARTDFDREIAEAFATDKYPGEAELESAFAPALGEVDRLLIRTREMVAIDDPQARAFARHEVRRSVDQVDTILARLTAVNAAHGRADVSRIAGIRASSVRLMFALNMACVAFSALAAFLALRSLKRQNSLELAHEALLEGQAAELGGFASRVAHDLLTPLSALSFTLSSLKRNFEKGASIDEPLQRAEACLKRSRVLVEGVMDFARSGGAPTGGRANLRATLDGALDEARAAPAGVEIVVEDFDGDAFVACSAGVLTSILSNLVNNAVKYMGDRPDKRVTIRATTGESKVRVEVEDRGPGLPPGLEQHVFEPYVRSADNAKPGLGLGLATVQRFVESHRGRVGVDSSPGEGCTFWFELPAASEHRDRGPQRPPT